jgi:hypothetical protein
MSPNHTPRTTCSNCELSLADEGVLRSDEIHVQSQDGRVTNTVAALCTECTSNVKMLQVVIERDSTTSPWRYTQATPIKVFPSTVVNKE